MWWYFVWGVVIAVAVYSVEAFPADHWWEHIGVIIGILVFWPILAGVLIGNLLIWERETRGRKSTF